MALTVQEDAKKLNFYPEIESDLSWKSDQLESDFELILQDGKLSLVQKDSSFKPLFCDFFSPSYLKEVKQNYSRSENVYSFLRPLIKKSKTPLKIIDETAGVGRDLFKFVLAGQNVKGFERDPLVFALLKDGLKRFQENHEGQKSLQRQFHNSNDFKCELFYGDSTGFKNTEGAVDLIYYDPMFFDESKKAAPKKAMQLLKKLNLNKDSEIEKEEHVSQALQCSKYVVMKCPASFKTQLKYEKSIPGKGYKYLIFNGE